MHYFNIELKTNLEVRPIQRDEDLDLFIQALGIPVQLETDIAVLSRIQFPKVKALLIRLSSKVDAVTCHVLRDVDLFSSFANFEVHKPLKEITVYNHGSYIELRFN